MISVAAFIEIDGKILFGKRDDSASFANKWELPGGKVEHDESPQEALVRELSEELSIEGRVAEELARSNFHHKGRDYELIVFRFFPKPVFDLKDLPKRVHFEFGLKTIDEALLLRDYFVDSDFEALLKIKTWPK